MKRYLGTFLGALVGIDYDHLIDQARCDRDTARDELETTAKQLEMTKLDLATCRASFKESMKEADRLAKERDELHTQLRRSDDIRSKLIDESDALSQALNKANVELYTVSQERDTLKQQLDTLKSSIKQLIS